MIETERLHLRPLIHEDAEMIFSLFNEPDVLTYIGDKGIDSLSAAQDYLTGGPINMQSSLGFSLYCCLLKDTGQAIGISGLIKRDGIDFPEVGFAFLAQHCGHGYGFESAEAVIQYARTALCLNTLQAITHPENTRSINLLIRLGFSSKSIISLPSTNDRVELFELTV